MTIYPFLSLLESFGRFLWYFCLTILVVGCASPLTRDESESVTSTEVISVPSGELRATPTSAFLTVTPSPTPTITVATNTPIPPAAASPVTTMVPVPTLTIVEEKEIVQALMATNGGCQLPCWWGIEFGESLDSVGQKFIDIGLPGWNVRSSDFGDDRLMGTLVTGYYDLSSSILYVDISQKFYTVDDAVQLIIVSVSRPSYQIGEPEFVRDWQQYSLSSMLQEYGKPTEIFLILQTIADPSPPIYSMILSYPERGIFSSYGIKGFGWTTVMPKFV